MRKFRRSIAVAVLASLSFSVPVWAGSVSAAKSRVVQAQDFADQNRKDDALDKLKEAETFLDGLTDDEKAPVVKSITDLRQKLSSAVDPEVSNKIERDVARYLSFAEGDADSSANSASRELDQAVDAINTDDAKKNLNADARAKLQTRIDALQKKLKAGNSSADAKRFTNKVESDLRAADENGDNDPRFARTRLDEAAGYLASDEAKQKLDDATMQRLREAVATSEKKFAASTKKDALARALPAITELEQKLASDPFQGVDSNSAYKVTEEVGSLRSRAAYQLTRIPDDDADRKTNEDRLAAAQKKMDGYEAAWASANVEAAVVNRWKFEQQGFEGWDNENASAGPRPFDKPKLAKTEQAVQLTKSFLDEKETADARKKGADLPKAAGAIAEADKTLADAQAKLDGAFNQWMDAAEKQPRPQGENRFDIGAAQDMVRWADDRLAGSKYHDADVARGKKLDQRWQDELAAIKQQHEEALKKMTEDASAAWPGIVSSISPQEGFRPTDAASMKGKTFLFKNIRNRSGWDFDGSYDLVMWIDGQPVAGSYDPKIRKAFADVSNQIGDSVDDHKDWDVIAVIDGTGSANRRFTTEVKDEHMNVLGKIEGTRPVDCVVVHVIAVHAGPIAMGGK